MILDSTTLAAQLYSAYLDGTTRIPPPTTLGPTFNIDSAHATEAAIAQIHIARGSHPVGVKVGYANKAAWRILNLETLVWAHMYSDTVHHGATQLSLPYYRAPKIEPEIVFKLKSPVDPAAPLESVEWLAVGFEIIDSPFTDAAFQPADFVAAYGLHLALVIGEPVPVTPANILELSDALARFKLRLSRNGELIEEGTGRNSLRSPALCLAELASAMLRRGTPLSSGDLVSSGTLTAGSPITPGELWTAEPAGLPLSELKLQFPAVPAR